MKELKRKDDSKRHSFHTLVHLELFEYSFVDSHLLPKKAFLIFSIYLLEEVFYWEVNKMTENIYNTSIFEHTVVSRLSYSPTSYTGIPVYQGIPGI